MEEPIRHHRFKESVLLGAVIILVIFLFGSWCPIEHIIGIPCPGCNMFTALYWLFVHLDVETACWFHPAVIPLLLYAMGALYYVLRYPDARERGKHKGWKACNILFLIIFLGVYIVRMLTIFPLAPMIMKQDAVFIRILHYFHLFV